MGACSLLPRIIGQGRASELLYFGRSMSGEEGSAGDSLRPEHRPLGDAQAAAARIQRALPLPMASPRHSCTSSGTCLSIKPLSVKRRPGDLYAN
ncbi:MAG: hypothetical protein CM15mP125_1250 [Gammaproteobacteria bacterium]|nr:MAG: hypothetical protein CM15mP125_1250 [Gammaproteobacteria bacterium]